MLVYGDRQERCDPRLKLHAISGGIECARQMPPGLQRHSRVVSVLIETGRLLQGIADSDFESTGFDRRTPAGESLARLLLQLATAVCRSWDSGFADIAPLPSMQIDEALPGEVRLKIPEGFAFYAVYPEAYAEAARRLRLVAPPRVIGIRSIGTSLAAVVAAALGAPCPATVRPVGDPYDRELAIGPALERELLDGEPHYVIVDEGPGQSGSSFGAVGDWLQQRGVSLDRVALLPSHSGAPGAAAREERRNWWNRVQKEPARFSQPLAHTLERWCAEAFGPLDRGLCDASAGEWRRLRFNCEQAWPAAALPFERRKFIADSGGRPVLLKFAGLGELGEGKLGLARTLHSEGLVPEPLGLVHGFLAESWIGDASPLAPGERPIEEIARYLVVRAQLLPAVSGSGASTGELLRMARRNISLEMGKHCCAALDRWTERAADLDRKTVRVRTDNKLDRQEWLRSRDGALIKTDALDHDQAHDLVGCQSIEWDIAGAIVEFDLHQDEAGQLIRSISAAGPSVDPELVEFGRVAYLAFRLGQARLAATMAASDEPEQRRLTASGDLYSAALRRVLQHQGAATRPISLVG